MSKGRLFIISGPSGSGKDTILKELFNCMKELKFSISSITRQMRSNEKQGEKYNFISREEFEKMISKGELLEYNTYSGNYYGTPKAPVEEAIKNGQDIVVEVDVNGAANIRKSMLDNISIFIAPPSIEILKSRLSSRGTETEEEIKKRMDVSLGEIARANEYDYIVINDELESAVKDIVDIIRIDRLRAERNLQSINKILDKCEVQKNA